MSQLKAIIYNKSQEVRDEFLVLAHRWHRDTSIHSNPKYIFTHPDYIKILLLGEPAISLIFEGLIEQKPEFGGHRGILLLMNLSKEYPIKKEHQGDIEQMIDDWIHWGILKGYIIWR